MVVTTLLLMDSGVKVNGKYYSYMHVLLTAADAPCNQVCRR